MSAQPIEQTEEVPEKDPAPAYAIDTEHDYIPPESSDEIPPFDYEIREAVTAAPKAEPLHNSAIIPDLPDNTATPSEEHISPAGTSTASPSPKTNTEHSSGSQGRAPLSAFPDIMEEIKEKNKLLGSLLTESKAYSCGTDAIVITIPVFASTMLKNDKKMVAVIENSVKKYVGDVAVKFELLGAKKEEEWEL